MESNIQFWKLLIMLTAGLLRQPRKVDIGQTLIFKVLLASSGHWSKRDSHSDLRGFVSMAFCQHQTLNHRDV